MSCLSVVACFCSNLTYLFAVGVILRNQSRNELGVAGHYGSRNDRECQSDMNFGSRGFHFAFFAVCASGIPSAIGIAKCVPYDEFYFSGVAGSARNVQVRKQTRRPAT